MIEGPLRPGESAVDWPGIFGGARPLHCEIGSGRGAFALDFAAREEVNLVAIEQRRSDAEDLRRRRDARGLKNLEVLQGDARLLLPRLFVPGSVAAFHLHCPDPWWKNRHHRRRLFADDFGLWLYRLLRVGGELDLRTDVRAYAAAMVETCEEVLGFENAAGPGAERSAQGLVLSSRERRYQATGQRVFRYLYRRPDRPPLTESAAGSRRRRGWTDVRRR